jgi:hypothetical protein
MARNQTGNLKTTNPAKGVAMDNEPLKIFTNEITKISGLLETFVKDVTKIFENITKEINIELLPEAARLASPEATSDVTLPSFIIPAIGDEIVCTVGRHKGVKLMVKKRQFSTTDENRPGVTLFLGFPPEQER